jgi:hypothetical protein
MGFIQAFNLMEPVMQAQKYRIVTRVGWILKSSFVETEFGFPFIERSLRWLSHLCMGLGHLELFFWRISVCFNMAIISK